MTNETSRIVREMPKRIPTNGTFELTVRCNLHCKMCLFRHSDSENEEIMLKELTAKQWIDMASQVAEAGTMHLLITGGEPMLRTDFCEIWEGIYNRTLYQCHIGHAEDHGNLEKISTASNWHYNLWSMCRNI